MTPFSAYKSAEPLAVSARSHASLDAGSRLQKLKKISIILRSFCDLSRVRLLDIGIGNGAITAGLAALCREAVGVDVVDERVEKAGYEFHVVKHGPLPFGEGSFDVVVSNHVIHLMPDQITHLREIARVLRPGGICYIAFPNKFSLMQPRYHRPWLGLLPGSILEQLGAWKWIDFRLTPISWWRLRKLAAREFEFVDLTLEVVRHPEKYEMKRPRGGLNRWAPGLLTRLLAPTCIAVLRKRGVSG